MSEYYAGIDCKCNAWNYSECACDADWTDPRIYKLEAKVAELESENERLRIERDESENWHYALANHLQSIIQFSDGVAGYHLNGAVAFWDDLDLNLAESVRLLAKRDLEQQAKGVEDLYKWFAETYTNASDRGYRYKAFVSELRNQAKEKE
jgi:hypothetical protein